MKRITSTLLSALAASLPVPATAAAAAACTAQSPAHRIALVELYTSEGCSSCPPADQYLASLSASGKLIPLSLHVDYWNYIGWKDPFSRAAFSERQRWLSDLARSRTIYTPELFVGGRELRGGPGGGWLGRSWEQNLPAAVARINAMPAQADISIALGAAGQGGLPVSVEARSAQRGRLFVALMQDGVASQVQAGENKGRLLRHEHVVREWLVPQPLAGGTARVAQTVPLPPEASISKLSVVAFVQNDEGEVLQALAQAACQP